MATNYAKTLMDMQLAYLLDDLLNGAGEWLPKASDKYYNAVDLSDQSLKRISFETYKQSTASASDLALIFHASYERSDDDNAAYAPAYKI